MTSHKTWWGQPYKTRGPFYYPNLRENPLDYEVPMYRMAPGKCASCGKNYPVRVGLDVEIVRQYPDPHIKPQPGQRCLACAAVAPALSKRPRDYTKVMAERRAMHRARSLGIWWVLGAALFVGALCAATLAVVR